MIGLFEHQPGFVRRDLLRLRKQRIAFLFLPVCREVLGEVDNPAYLPRREFKGSAETRKWLDQEAAALKLIMGELGLAR